MMSFEVPFEALGLTLVHFCWQGAVIAGAARLVTLAAPGLRPGPRYTVHLVALIAMAVTAVATFGWEWTRLAGHETLPSDVLSVARVSAASGFAFKDVLPWLDTIWALGVIGLSLRMMGGLWLIHRLSAEAQAVPAALEARFAAAVRAVGLKNVRLRMHAGIDGPFVVGIVRSIVYLPVSAVSALSPDQLDAVLAHELEHVRRADFAWNLLQTAIETLFFYHPAVWWLGKTLRDQRELACDDAAVTLCRDPLTYATALLELEERRPARKLSPSLAMALGGKDGSLLARVRRVLGEGSGEGGGRSPARPALVAAPLIVAVLAALAVPVTQVAAHSTEASKKQCRIKAAESVGGSGVDVKAPKIVDATMDDRQSSDDAGSDESPAAEATDADVEPKDFWSGLTPGPLDENRVEAFKFKAGKMAQAWKIKARDWKLDSQDWKHDAEAWKDKSEAWAVQARELARRAQASIDQTELRRAQAEGLREGAEQARRQAEAMADQNSLQARSLRQAAAQLARQARAMTAEAPEAPEAPEPPEAALAPTPKAPPAPPAPPAAPKAPKALSSLDGPATLDAKDAVKTEVVLRIKPGAHPTPVPSPRPNVDLVVRANAVANPDVQIRIFTDRRS